MYTNARTVITIALASFPAGTFTTNEAVLEIVDVAQPLSGTTAPDVTVAQPLGIEDGSWAAKTTCT
jgi:hypothetical protein